ncbi:hypothetical protein [Rhodococcus sp. FH8]|uniref:hypothetical protein n=1 Tax=Rhodococcus sp. FH8 TaxID=1761013 RepID=UPI001C4FCA8F|nr:hypothetical protein [Rhodococcus sp. FH8]MDJ0106234.1 hypothetical protein [Rhodococcus erythropolis]
MNLRAPIRAIESSAGLSSPIRKSPDPVQKLSGKLFSMAYCQVGTDTGGETVELEGSGAEIDGGVQSTTEFKS